MNNKRLHFILYQHLFNKSEAIQTWKTKNTSVIQQQVIFFAF